MSDEPFFPKWSFMNQFRLRSAYGASGVQPGATSSLVTFTATTLERAGPARDDRRDRHARPSRQRARQPEPQAGDVGGVRGRVRHAHVQQPLNLEFTYYNKQTKDALFSQADRAVGGRVGTTRAPQPRLDQERRASKPSLHGDALDRPRTFGWDVTLNGSHNTNKIVSLGIDANGLPNRDRRHRREPRLGRLSDQRVVLSPVHVHDANSDGFIEPTKSWSPRTFALHRATRSRATSSRFRTASICSNRKLRINALFDYKGGFSLQQHGRTFSAAANPCPGESKPTRRSRSRRRNIANAQLEPDDGVRAILRERPVLALPRAVRDAARCRTRLAARLRAQDASLVLAASQSEVVDQVHGRPIRRRTTSRATSSSTFDERPRARTSPSA